MGQVVAIGSQLGQNNGCSGLDHPIVVPTLKTAKEYILSWLYYRSLDLEKRQEKQRVKFCHFSFLFFSSLSLLLPSTHQRPIQPTALGKQKINNQKNTIHIYYRRSTLYTEAVFFSWLSFFLFLSAPSSSPFLLSLLLYTSQSCHGLHLRLRTRIIGKRHQQGTGSRSFIFLLASPFPLSLSTSTCTKTNKHMSTLPPHFHLSLHPLFSFFCQNTSPS